MKKFNIKAKDELDLLEVLFYINYVSRIHINKIMYRNIKRI